MARGTKRAAVDAGPVEGPWALPEGWRWERLGAIATTKGGGALKLNKSHYRESGVCAFSASGQDGYVDVAEFHRDAVILSSIGARCGKCFLATGQWTSLANTQIIFPNEEGWAKYLWLYLNDENRWPRSGSAQPFIRPSDIRNVPIPVPPPGIRDAIARLIEELFGEVDDGERALAAASGGAETYREAVLYAAATGALTEAWSSAEASTSTGEELLGVILKERHARSLARSPTRGAGYRPPIPPALGGLPGLPPSWCWASLDQLCSLITSGSRAWAPYYDRGDCVFVMAQNVRRGRYDGRFRQLVDPPANDPDRRRTRVARDDLLLTIVGANTGDLCRVDFDPVDHFVCQSVALLRPVEPLTGLMAELFLSGAFGRALQMDRFIYGAGRPHLSFDQIKSLAIPLPPLDEIARISQRVTEMTEELPGTDLPGMVLANLRQSILAAAFRGDLVA